jgi:hypothetical protein
LIVTPQENPEPEGVPDFFCAFFRKWAQDLLCVFAQAISENNK